MSRKTAIPFFGNPPVEYNQRFFADLVRNFSVFVQQERASNVDHDGTGSVDEVAFFTETNVIGGSASFTWNGQELVVTGSVEADEFIGDLRGATLFKAQAGEALAKGDVVYISGISGNTTVVSKADADVAAEMPAFGVAAAATSINNPVDVYTSGVLAGLNTSSFSEGDELFVSNTPGVLSNTPPTGESSQLQKLAKVTRSHASSGSIFIMGAGRTNAVPNLNTGRLFVGNSSNQAVADGTLYVDIANSRVGIGTTSPASPLTVAGVIESTSGGVKFPDGTTQTTASAGGGGNVSNTGTPLNNQIAIWTNATTIKGDSELTWDGDTLSVNTSGAPTIVIDGAGPQAIQFKESGSTTNSPQIVHRTNPDTIGIEKAVDNTSLFYYDIDDDFAYFKGNVGIGTTSPDASLHIASTNPIIRLEDTDQTANLKRWNINASATGTLRVQAVNDANVGGGSLFDFERDGTNIKQFLGRSASAADYWFTINNTDEMVGIGTKSPASKLHVNVDSTATYLATFEGDLGTNNNRTIRLKTPDTDSISEPFTWQTGNSVAWQIDATEAMRLNSAGNLGIGTSSPSSPLTVAGVIESTTGGVKFPDGTTQTTASSGGGNVSNTGTPANNQIAVWTDATTIEGDANLRWTGTRLDIEGSDTTLLAINGTGTQARMLYQRSGTTHWNIGVTGVNHFTFFDQAAGTSPVRIEQGAPTNSLVVDTTGRIGVGTNSPSEAIDVSGTVKATEMVGRIVSGSTTTGTVVLSDANKKITMTGSMTVPSGTFAQDDTILFDGNGTARTLTPASGLTIYVNGTAVTNPATVAIPANGIVGLTFRSGTVAIATGVDPEANKYYYSATSTDTTTNHNASFTPTVVDFNSQLLNQGSFTESGGRITVPVAGVYRIYGQVTFTRGGTEQRMSLQLQIFKNATAESGRGRGSYIRGAGNVDDSTAYIEDFVNCAASDILDIRAFRDGVAGTSILNASQSRLLIEKL